MTDPNGAIIQGATVQLVDATRQVTIRTVQTNEEGQYQFAEVEPATYTIVITSAGFAEARLNEVKVEPNRNLQLDAALSLGTATEEVTVTASQELIDRETPTLGTNVNRDQVQNLPLNGRNVLDLASLQPGVIPGSGGFGSGLGIRVNGSRGVENNITLDGSNNNEVAIGSATGAQPRPDAVQEFRLLTSNFEAEFGRNTGSVINVVVRSGANQYHGNARIFYRPTFLSAARFFDQDQPTDRPLNGPGDFRRRFERKEYGGNIGGPIYLPRFGEGGPAYYSGKDRLFFFVDFERRAQLIGDTRQLSNLPTIAERGGLFTRRAPNATTAPTLLRDPATGLPFPIVSGTVAPGATVQQQIPTSRFSPIGQFYLGFLPTPDASGRASVGANAITNNNYATGRVDYIATQSQTFNFTFNVFKGSDFAPFAFGGANIPGFGAFNNRKTYNYVGRHTYTITPNLINTLLLGYARNNQPSVSPDRVGILPTSIGFATNAFVADPSVAGVPFVRLLDRGISLGSSIQGPQTRITENFQIQDAVSYTVGDHRFKFGFDGTKYKQDQAFLFINNGLFTFSGVNGGNTTGDDLADLLIGNTPIAQQFGSAGLRDFRQQAGALFVQDTYRVREDLTLSLGLRYEYNSPLTDLRNRVAYYRPGTVSQLLTSGNLRDDTGRPIIVPAGRRAPVGVVFVGDPDPVLGGTVPAGGIRKDFNNFAPRVGFAYSPRSSEGSFRRTLLGDNATVIRAGFGVFYGSIIGDTVLQSLTATGFGGTNAFFFPGGGTFADPFGPDAGQGTIPNPFLSTGAITVSAPLSQFAQPIDPNIRTPYNYQYNATVERSFLRNFVARASYVGNRGLKLYAQLPVNPSLGTFFAANRTIPTPTISNANLRRSNDDIRLGINQLVSAGNSRYNSFQAQLQKRAGADGLNFEVSYTFSKLLTDSDTQRGGLDLIDRRFGFARSSDDVPHRFVVNSLYEIPFTRNFNGIARVLLHGFTIGGIYQIESGRPFSVGNPFDTTGTGGGIISLADLGTEPFRTLNPRTNNALAFNTAAFSQFGNPATGFVLARDFRRGTSLPNQFRLANGINNFDFILIKRTPLGGERANLELRFEAFNALNRTQFTTANTNLLSPQFGQFTDTRESRVIQLAARINF